MKKLISLLSIFLLIGCSVEPTPIYEFELNAGLELDENGYYHLEMEEGVTQVLHKFEVDTNNPNIQMVHWVCDTYYEMDYFGYTELVPIINESSYTYTDGKAYTMFGPHSEQVGDTVMVMVGYTDTETLEVYVLNFMVVLD
jgi:hypothetical protein